jgi:hypothetical protein
VPAPVLAGPVGWGREYRAEMLVKSLRPDGGKAALALRAGRQLKVDLPVGPHVVGGHEYLAEMVVEFK